MQGLGMDLVLCPTQRGLYKNPIAVITLQSLFIDQLAKLNNDSLFFRIQIAVMIAKPGNNC